MAIQADPTEEDLTQENERPQEQGLGTTSLVVLGALGHTAIRPKEQAVGV